MNNRDSTDKLFRFFLILQVSEILLQRASSSAGDDCEGADDEPSEEVGEQTCSDTGSAADCLEPAV